MNNSLIRLIVPGIVVFFSLVLLINQIQQRRHAPANQPPQPQIPLRYLAIGLILLVLGVLFIPWGPRTWAEYQNEFPIHLVLGVMIGFLSLIGFLGTYFYRRWSNRH
ncbi:hypothetical protein J5F27_01720 [Schleiferilactobacillus harbinensis]|uniref:hypothetical protein n=1 Tax=Schleiferilactobacillus harbinensis TaxID=304207 RepID=UPI001AAF2265|nr:hypothetical protein [Schleiferilactobacillus harbinensis]MBO3090636.1 hypothetical protein [Schleiferilactobacillus harbinensis]